ncbi:MAG: BlaI/MecI/CopY family transcriptional regulator [Pirellulaceae bacterium]|nr:BlaI/MecI/CopY family transcriptional regulator [Pirellulaceae bacterium]
MAIKKSPPPLSSAQLEIMEIVWDRGEVAVSEAWEILSTRRPVARNTVLTTLTRLEAKGWLKHRTVGRTFFYSATRLRTATIGQMVRQLVDTTFGGSAEGLVMALLEDRGVTKMEADRIRAMLDEAEPEQRKKKP